MKICPDCSLQYCIFLRKHSDRPAGSPCLVRCIGRCPHQNSSSIEVDIEPGKGGDYRHMTKADSGTADRIRERRGLVLSSGC